MALKSPEWAPIPSTQLNIGATLLSGQNFRWRHIGNEWLGVIDSSVVKLTPCEEGFWWQTYPDAGDWETICHYFSLDVDLASLYSQWLEADPRLNGAIESFAGMRILRQDFEEVFFSFLCAC